MRHEIDKLELNYIERFQTNAVGKMKFVENDWGLKIHKSRCHKDKNIIDLFHFLLRNIVSKIFDLALLYIFFSSLKNKNIKIDKLK
ncbi:hypothetical protein BpHYR1_009112 [Brachionus plicatilis]|uniref:Uncharacterized protein n=1 Tax=Brachionus plicatilis TaxID=10195 RepID=A0A3M7SG78_BRAPC|nr:hypothetical protein BpHYR1_009112 [Brachionus plicatilis]